MSSDKKYGVIPPKTDLQKRFGGKLPPLDEAAISRVEDAMHALEEDMADWIKTDIDRLIAAQKAYAQDSQSEPNIKNLHLAAHDLRGLGTTYGFPVVSIIADNLCKALETAIAQGDVPEDMVNAHVGALRAVVNLDLRDPDGGPASELVRGLRAIVEKKLG